MKQGRRVSPRVPYDEAVSLVRVDGKGRLYGRSIDLGPTGIYVTCAELCEIGTELVCAVLLPGGPRRLRGRVVRLVALPRSVGIAIAFADLKDADRTALERLVASRLGETMPVKVRVGGFDHDLRCEAVLGERTMHVSTALPSFLRLDASVDVDIGGGPRAGGGEPKAHGVISRIALDPNSRDGVPRLAFDVHLGDADADGERGGDELDEPPSGLPRPYGHPQPSVLLSRRYAFDLAAAEPSAAPPRRRRKHGTAEIARRLGDGDMRLVSPPEREQTLRFFAANARAAERPFLAAWVALPMLLVSAAIILLSRLAH
jgi:hypothetical protein